MVGVLGTRALLVAQTVKHLPAVRETQVQSLGQEDPLEKEMATRSSILGLENPMDGGAWWATVHGISESQTRLNDFTGPLPLWKQGRGRKSRRAGFPPLFHIASSPPFLFPLLLFSLLY